MAEACLIVMNPDRETYAQITTPILSHINVGTGTEASGAELARLVVGVTRLIGRIAFVSSKPVGVPRKHMNLSRLSDLGWRAKIRLREGIEDTYRRFLSNAADLRGA
jgi:GDP-L-fucose synthase